MSLAVRDARLAEGIELAPARFTSASAVRGRRSDTNVSTLFHRLKSSRFGRSLSPAAGASTSAGLCNAIGRHGHLRVRPRPWRTPASSAREERSNNEHVVSAIEKSVN